MEKNVQINQAIELIRLKVLPEQLEGFLTGRKKVDEFVSGIAGHIGTEILRVKENEYLMLIRWADESAVKAAQKITETSPIISDWINSNAQFLAFETGISEYAY